MRSCFIRLLAAVSLFAVLVAGCGPPDDLAGEATAASLVGTAANVLTLGYRWMFDNVSGCTLEVVAAESALAEGADLNVMSELERWTPLILPDDTLGVPVDPAVLAAGYSGSFPWPLTLREYVPPGEQADPACDWLPLDVKVRGPALDKHVVIVVIGEQGAISYR